MEPATITSTLTITNVHISDAGQYYCQAVSRFGSSKSRLANLLYLDSAGNYLCHNAATVINRPLIPVALEVITFEFVLY